MAYADFVRSLKRDIVDLKAELRPLESGQLQCAQRQRGGLWVDTTQQQIRAIKNMIATLESVVTRYENEKPGDAKKPSS